jgi:hypothetical protein
MPEVINTGLFLPFGRRGVSKQAAESALLQDLICYDRVYVLSDQMSAVPRLVELLGLAVFERAINEGALAFVHDRQILAWPVVPGYQGLVPFDAIASVPTPGQATGYSQRSTEEICHRLLLGHTDSVVRARQIARAVAAVTTEFGMLEETPVKAEQDANELLVASLDAYGAALAAMNPGELPLQPHDLRKLQKEVRKRKAFGFKGSTKYKVMTLDQATGPASMEPVDSLPPKQLAFLNLCLSDRFLSIHAKLNSSATLHSEPAVERILAARAAAVRAAAAGEVDVVLESEQVYLPVLAAPGPFPYSELLDARSLASGEAFRKLVADRDKRTDAKLIQEYVRALKRPVAERLEVRAGRLVLSTLVGAVVPGVGGLVAGFLAGAADTFGTGKVLERRDAAYYVDTSLRRIAARGDAQGPDRARV